MLGGKFRDRIRCYADTTESRDPQVYGKRLKERRDQGFTWLKMDLGIDLLDGVPGTVTRPAGAQTTQGAGVQHMFTGIDGEGPFGGSGATKVWRSFLTDAYAKNFAKAGGIGIADHVYRSLIAQQEIQ